MITYGLCSGSWCLVSFLKGSAWGARRGRNPANRPRSQQERPYRRRQFMKQHGLSAAA